MMRMRLQRIVARSIVVFTAAAALVGVAPSSGSADPPAIWQYSTSFEGPTQDWQLSGSGSGSGLIYTGSGPIINGCAMAFDGCGGVLLRPHGPGGYQAVGKAIRLPYYRNGICNFSAWVQRRTYGGTITVNVEVINPATWDYIAVRSMNLKGPGTGVWQLHGVEFYNEVERDAYLRVSVLGGSVDGDRTVNVDYASISCMVSLV